MITTDAKHRANIRRTRRERGQLFEYSSVVVWQGESPADGAPIAAIVTNLNRGSENGKTGDMAQVYILRTDIRPVAAVGSGLDTSTCGNCPLRPLVATGAKCYVNTGWLGRLWESIPTLPRVSPEIVGEFIGRTGLELREGAYGDPAMVPMNVRDALNVGRGTSYSHQWAESWNDPRSSDYSMASVQTVAEKNAANDAGYRTYRVTSGELEPDEILCPEITSGATCKACGLCAGNRVQAKNIVIRPI